MDSSAGGGAVRGVASPVQSARKEWRVVSEHQSAHTASDGEPDRLKVGQSNERTIYEVQKGRELDADFCSITIDGGVQNDILQQRLNHVSRQREELQKMEVELRAQVIVRSEIMKIQNRFEAQIKEHANNSARLQEQVNDRDRTIQELERKMEVKDREIHAIKLDNEEAWAKEGLLREQNKELASFRERVNSEAERAHHFQQIHDLQEHVKEKERQLLELQEQQRVTQETILFKDDQLREAQAWMTRAQELDTIHSTTNHSLQAELRERTEQYNQLWLGCQRQFAEMERLHFNAIQQLQLELAGIRERNGIHKEESTPSHSITKDAPQFGHDNGHHDASGSVASNGESADHSNGNEESATHFAAVENASQAEHNLGIPFTPSLLGLSPYLSPAQTAVHPFMIHQQGVPNPALSHVPQNHGGHFQSVETNLHRQHWQHQQFEMPLDDQTLPSHYVDAHISQGFANGAAASSIPEESQDQKPVGNAYMVEPQSQDSLQRISFQFQDTLNLNHLENRNIEASDVPDSNDHSRQSTRPLSKTDSGENALISDAPVQPANSKEVAPDSNPSDAAPHAITSAILTNLSSVGKTSDSLLLDERLLLACIARTMPASGKISISSTLPNRLAKMLAPLHWHDYKKTYGKLDDFVVGHPELFVIEGDFIKLKEGAQKKIAATAAAAKVAAAAAAPSPYSSVLQSVAVTPIAHSYRLKRSSSNEVDHNSQYMGIEAQHSNGIHFNLLSGSGKDISSSIDHLDLNGSEIRFSRSDVSMSTTNAASRVGSTNARMPSNFVGRQHGRAPGTTINSQR
ncbi:hypothetical protein QQ045_030663 [Rhodiola kirilowii]